MEAIVFVILQIFFLTRAVLKIGEYNQDIPQFQLGNIQSRDPFLMDFDKKHLFCSIESSFSILTYSKVTKQRSKQKMLPLQ